jgi:hypothetical protein
VSEPDECPEAQENPRCPYLSQINQCAEDIKQVKLALIGSDMQGGLVQRFTKVEDRIKKRYTIKDVGAILLGLAALVTAVAAILHI